MNDMLTLRQLLSRLPKLSNKRVPGKDALVDGGTVVADYKGSDFRIRVFASGYALAEAGKRWTVFAVSKCGGYDYDPESQRDADDDLQAKFDAGYFMDLPWPIRVTMLAEDRLESNNDEAFSRLISEHPGYIENIPWLFGCEPSAESVVIRELTRKERLAALTLKQRQAVEMWLDGYMGRKIAEVCRIDPSTVCRRLHAAFKRMKTA
jgi:Response regulator